MDYIDILQLLKLYGGKLDKVVISGYIDRKLERPGNLHQTCGLESNGIFVRMSVCCIDLSYYSQYLKENGMYTPDGKYFVNGCVCMYVSANGNYPDWYSCPCTLRLGSKTSDEYVCTFAFGKKNGNWYIRQNQLDDMYYSDFTGRINTFLQGAIKMPLEVQTLRPMLHVLREEPVPLSKKPAASGNTEEQPEEIKQGVSKEVVKSTLVLEDRFEVKSLSKKYEELSDVCDEAMKKLDNNLMSLSDKYPLDADHTGMIRDIMLRLEKYMVRKPTPRGRTGRDILNKYMKSNFPKLTEKKYSGITCGKMMIEYWTQVTEFVTRGVEPSFEGDALRLCESAFCDVERFFAGLVSEILGVPMKKALRVLAQSNISLISLVTENPYMLFMLGLISYDNAIRLGFVWGTESLERFRDVCILHNTIMSSGNDTLYKVNAVPLEEVVTQYAMKNRLALFNDVESYLHPVTYYDEKNYTKKGYRYIRKLPKEVISDYIGFGMGVQVDGYLTTSKLLDMELFVYKTLREMAERDYKYEEVLSEYEEMKGFTLEAQQRSAVKLLSKGAGVLTGGAGSGKTTTVDYLVYTIGEDSEVRYGAPTGKAAKVLQGVVKRPVKTMHSLCRIGLDTPSLLDEEDFDRSTQGGDVVYIFDETSMVTIDLLYRVLRVLGDSCRMYFVGDVHQLNAIGKGMVLRNLLGFLPCVCLEGCKRSTGGIVRNANSINKGGVVNETEDFRLIDIANDDIPNAVLSICKYYLGKGERVFDLPALEGITQNDIQVVTPFTKKSYSWGATALNDVLEPIFNPTGKRIYTGSKYLRVGDRVIHTQKNNGDMQWYSKVTSAVATKEWGYGIANGEVGKVVGFYNGLTIEEPTTAEPFDFEDFPDDIRDDSDWDGWFIVVEYMDYMKDKPFYILYRGMCYDDPEYGRKIYGHDVGLLDLFYAGTVHKMQGSQAKIVIGCLGSVPYKGFITRNLVYTMVTRGESLVILLGSVVGSSSQLAISSNDVADEGVLTIGNYLNVDK